ncbi:winged helix-turn-helix domain-containing protein [Pantoea dispersa]|uniref:winged helix-turn-helix domain-containing protein n=1 Tax=Pantoea dispersa TaxID=59814 RepID=UPI0039B659B5
MLDAQQIKALLEEDSFNLNDILILNGLINELSLPALDLKINLNESQKRLFLCLMHQINSKRDIISVVWNDNHQRMRDNNYHQLIFKTRHLLQQHGLPGKLIITVPYHGVKFNEPLLYSLIALSSANRINNREHHKGQVENKSLIPRLIGLARGLF